METLKKLQVIQDFTQWAAGHKIDASPLALLEYLDQTGRIHQDCDLIEQKDQSGETTYICTRCGQRFELHGTPDDNNYNYCPDCGAVIDNIITRIIP